MEQARARVDAPLEIPPHASPSHALSLARSVARSLSHDTPVPDDDSSFRCVSQLPNGLAFGGNLEARFFGLWLRDDFESGRSDGPCATYSNSPCLASSSEFQVAEVGSQLSSTPPAPARG